jgi:hypothetical protein
LRADRLRDRRLDQIRIPERRQADPEHSVRELSDQLGGGLDREPGLARAARPTERDQPSVAEQRGQLGHLPPPPDEARRRPRQVRVRECLQGRERLPAKLVDPHGLVEVLDPVLAEIPDLAVD